MKVKKLTNDSALKAINRITAIAIEKTQQLNNGKSSVLIVTFDSSREQTRILVREWDADGATHLLLET